MDEFSQVPHPYLPYTPKTTQKHAVLSEDGMYRYSLLRAWEPQGPTLTFVMLNPSTADADIDDPTIRRCVGFAKREGFGKLMVLNLYAFRATSPKDMLSSSEPVGPENDLFLGSLLRLRKEFGLPVVAAWGVNADPDRVALVRSLAPGTDWRCLGVTKDGHPRHPLYVKGDQPLIGWTGR